MKDTAKELAIFRYFCDFFLGTYVFLETFAVKFEKLRKISGMMTLGSFLYGVVIIHVLKAGLGRARPYVVSDNPELFSYFWGFGEDVFWAGSFIMAVFQADMQP